MSRARVLADRANQNTLAVDTTNSQVGVASTVPNATLDVGGDGVFTGIVTASSFSGDGSSLSGVGETVNVRTNSITSSGIVTITDTTDATSTTTGALIISGGVGIAKSLHVGQNITIGGTLTYEDVTNVDSVGLITAQSGVNVTGGQLQVGVAYSVGAAGVATATGFVGPLTGNVNGNLTGTVNTATQTNITSVGTLTGLTIDGNLGASVDFKVGSGITCDSNSGIVTSQGLRLADSKKLILGTGSDFEIYHSGSHSYLRDVGTGSLKLNASQTHILNAGDTEFIAKFIEDGAVELYYDTSKKFQTTNEGIEVTGFTSTTAGMGVTGGLFEGAWIKAGKLTDNLQIGIATANVFYFTTQETTTGTPNIRWDDTYSLSSKMAVGDVASVTVIATAAAGGYCANWTIDGNAVTEEWVGGSAPSAGGSDGLDIYSFTIIKTGTGTGDSGFKVIANVSNAT